MRAFAVRGFRYEAALLDLDMPFPTGEQDFIIRVAAAGVNPVDYKRVQWLTPDARYPYILGVDFAGTIERAPVGDHGFFVGDRVFGMARRTGAYTEHTLASQIAPGEAFARIPDGVSFEQAAVLPVAGVTALGSLALLAPQAGHTVVVLGASGGVGGYAVPLAREIGAHVIATTRGDEAEGRRLGAHEIFDISTGDPIARILAAYPNGVDAVLDLVSGKEEIGRVAQIVRRGGRLVSTLRVADEGGLGAKGVTAHNIAAPDNPKATQAGLAELANALVKGVIEARIASTHDLEHSGDALERVRRGGLRGKAVIRVSREALAR